MFPIQRVQRTLYIIHKPMSKIVVRIIEFYQKYISIAFPSSCRFIPTCSTYSKMAFQKYGLFRGFYLSVWRILRCNPWCKGGYDPLP